MSVSNDLVESSTFLNPVVPISNGDDFPSLEDQAWADSCFVGDSEISSSDWDSFKKALQDINISPVSEIEYLASSSVERTDDNASSDDGDEEEDADGDMVLYKTIKPKSKKTSGVSPFRPNYNEHLQENENPDLGLDFDFFDFTEDQLAKDIFKVWDLDFPTEEEDELIPENSIGKLPTTFNDLEALKDLKDGSLDDLINGISDLALDM